MDSSTSADVKFTEQSEVNAPTIEESHDQLVAEGLIPGEDGTMKTPDPAEAPGVPDKFKNEDGSVNVEALAKSYAELEKMRSTDETEEDDTADDDGGEEDLSPEEYEYDEDGEISAAEEAAEAAGLELDEISAEWEETGGLSQETYDALEEAGYPPAMVDVYIDGLVARTTSVRDQGLEAAGGNENYTEMVDWAIDTLTDAEIDAYDATMDGGDPAQITAAIKGLRARYDLANAGDATTEPEDMISGGQSGGDVYFSEQDMLNDMNDPRYDASPEFRAAVMRKIDRSNI